MDGAATSPTITSLATSLFLLVVSSVVHRSAGLAGRDVSGSACVTEDVDRNGVMMMDVLNRAGLN